MEPLDTKSVSDQNIKLTSDPSKKLTNLIAILTSFIAVLAAGSSLLGNRCSSRGSIYKNEAIYYSNLASNEWSYFQSRNIRKEISEIGLNFNNLESKSKEEVERFQRESDISFEKAKSFEAKRDSFNLLSLEYLEVSKTFSSALAFLQVAIVLIPLTLIAASSLIFTCGLAMGSVGLVFLVISIVQYLNIVT